MHPISHILNKDSSTQCLVKFGIGNLHRQLLFSLPSLVETIVNLSGRRHTIFPFRYEYYAFILSVVRVIMKYCITGIGGLISHSET